MTTEFPPTLEALVAEISQARPMRVWSLIVTVFGDVAAPRGGELWAGTISDICAAFGIGDPPVRAALSRLARDGWLERRREGRRSHYRLTGSGLAEFREAAEKVYGTGDPAWDGGWRIGILTGDAVPGAAALRGAGHLAGNVVIRPKPPHSPASAGPGSGSGILWLDAEGPREDGALIAAQAWQLDELASAYGAFIERFSALERDVEAITGGDGTGALVARILLVHQFRRLVLRDPLLPAALLPADWPGSAARELCARLYGALTPAAERWLDRHGRNADGPLPPADDTLKHRFPSR